MATVRLTVAQALVRFLAAQHSERDGQVQRLIPGCFGIFGHGNVAGVGQALLEAHVTGSADLPYYLARNEQAMVHAAVGFARMRNRPVDVLAEVGTGDVVLIPHGWHGPSIAAPGYHLYYLNVMAGPEEERAWRFCDDPAHAWIRGTWDGQAIDPRLPLTSTTEKPEQER